MKFIKSKPDLMLKICFTAQELSELILKKDYCSILNISSTWDRDHNISKKQILKLVNINTKSKIYEYYTAIFDLYDQFERNCNFCFNLKQSFNPSKDKIRSILDLEKYKDDPPDVIVSYKSNHYDFEIKRYKEKFLFEAFISFLNKNIISHYSDHQRNYLIILQLQPYTQITLEIFDELNIYLKNLNKDLGVISFSFNSNNEYMITVQIWPVLTIQKRTFQSGSQQFKNILKE